jgi:hypothetical protein
MPTKEMTVTQIVDQPAPQPNDRPSIQSLVRQDLEEREQVGIQRYGTPLQPHNGRDALVDAYQEALDLACYIRQEIQERRDSAAWTLRDVAERIDRGPSFPMPPSVISALVRERADDIEAGRG